MKPILLDLPFPIITPRLLLRPPIIGDGLELNTAIVESFDILHQFLSWAKLKPTLDESEEFIRRAIASWVLLNGTDEPWLPLFIFDKKSHELVGASGFFNVNWDIPSVEIGYWVRTKYANFGFMTEAINAITQYAFKQLHVKRMVISCDKDNTQSQKVAQRLNYNFEAVLKMHRIKPITGQISDTLIYTRHDLEGLPPLNVVFHKI